MMALVLGIVLGVIAVMTVLWALGRLLWWARVTFPPNRRRSRRSRTRR